ncbi:MAG: hypothetical protein FWH20_06285 [Oscillospiraceae bacterium]|nr:hypothetical protein [Oscillospiraceae bacterium]
MRKRGLAGVTAVALVAVFLAACDTADSQERQSQREVAGLDLEGLVSIEPEPEVEQEPEPEQPAESPYDLSPLEILGGYYIDEKGDMFLNLKLALIIVEDENGYQNIYETCSEPNREMFSKYIFGTWHYYKQVTFTSGDIEYVDITFSDKSNVNNYFAAQVGDGIFTDRANGELHEIFWVDKNRPDTMYFMNVLRYSDYRVGFGNINRITSNPYRTMTRVATREPQGPLCDCDICADLHANNYSMKRPHPMGLQGQIQIGAETCTDMYLIERAVEFLAELDKDFDSAIGQVKHTEHLSEFFEDVWIEGFFKNEQTELIWVSQARVNGWPNETFVGVTLASGFSGIERLFYYSIVFEEEDGEWEIYRISEAMNG